MAFETRTYYCYRPSLATKLSEAGYAFRKAPSPWNENRFTWVFELDKRGFEIVAGYYSAVGKPVPDFIKGVVGA